MIRMALENKLNTITPLIATHWENTSYVPISGTPYQSVNMIYGNTEDMAITNDLRKDQGIMQVTLLYPTLNGTKSVEDRAKLISSTFSNALKLYDDDDEVRISKTPDIKIMGSIADRFIIIVSIYWKSYSR